jgi:hypothetical protein
VTDDDGGEGAVLESELGSDQLASGLTESGIAGLGAADELRVNFVGEVAANNCVDDVSERYTTVQPRSMCFVDFCLPVISTTSLHGFLGLWPTTCDKSARSHSDQNLDHLYLHLIDFIINRRNSQEIGLSVC